MIIATIITVQRDVENQGSSQSDLFHFLSKLHTQNFYV